MTRPAQRPLVVVLCNIGFVVRNYLLGEFLPTVLDGADVLIVSPLADDPDFVACVSQPGVDVVAPMQFRKEGSRRLRMVLELLHAATVNTETWHLKMFDPEHHRETPLQRLRKRVLFGAARLAVATGVLRLVDALESRDALRTSAGSFYRTLFAERRPALVFSPAPLLPEERAPIQVARAMGIPTAVSVLSWDNLSSKSRLPLPVDAYLVWGRAMEEELRTFYPAVGPDQVRAVGALQFDFHRDPRMELSREAFFGDLELDPSRPLLVYAGVTPSLMPFEHRIVRDLLEAVRAGVVDGDPQVVIRLHPKDDGSRYEDVRADFPDVRFVVPGGASRGALNRWAPNEDDVRLLSNLLRHGDVHMNVCSTMTVDAAVLDRPVLNIRYDVKHNGAPISWGLRGYEYTHYLPVLASGGVRSVWSREQLIDAINDYLRDPAQDREGRSRLVAAVCDPVDGQAGARAAVALLDLALGATS